MYFPCVDVAVSLIFTQSLTLFFFLYSSNHLDDVILICRAGVLLAAQTTSWATDCIVLHLSWFMHVRSVASPEMANIISRL